MDLGRSDRGLGGLETDLDLEKLARMTSRASFEDVPRLADEILAGKTRGRVVIDL
jgi:acrylyl-CoA reductase (NADPH)